MIYGTRAVIEAIRAGREVEKIMIQTGLSNDLIKELMALAKQHNVPVLSTHADKLKRLSAKNHQGVISILSAVSFASLDNIIHKAYEEGRDPFLLLLDRVTDVRNFGAIVRTACREKDLKHTLKFLRENGIKLIACTEKAANTLYQVGLTGPIAIIMGSEEDGISDGLLRDADDLAAIPLKGEIGSLNVSVAAGVAMYEVVRQRG